MGGGRDGVCLICCGGELGRAKECSFMHVLLAHRSIACKSDSMLDGSSLGGLERDQWYSGYVSFRSFSLQWEEGEMSYFV